MDPRLLDLREVAQILHVSRSYAYQLIQRQKLPAVRLGRLLRVHPRDLRRYILKNRLVCSPDLQAFLRRRPGAS